MGCDIHLYQEKRVDGKWLAADDWQPSKYEDEKGRLTVPYDKRLYYGRNYNLFAMLAGVRNGVGFAGIPTGAAITPISPPRGIPEGISPQIEEEIRYWGSDGHSCSWLTLADLDAYNWDAPHVKLGKVGLNVYREWKRSGDLDPKEWCGDVTGPGIRIISETEAQTLREEVTDPEGRIYVNASWTTPLRDDAQEFLGAVRPRLQELERECGPGNARIVFFFDN